MILNFIKGWQTVKRWSAGSLPFSLRKRQPLVFSVFIFLAGFFPFRVFSDPQSKLNPAFVTPQPATWEVVIGKEVIPLPGYGRKETGLKTNVAPEPELVLPEKDGTLRLLAEKGRGIGPSIKYMPEWKAYGWFTAEDQIEWEVQVKRGRYDVYLEWSVSDEEAGKPFVFKAGKQLLTGTVEPSGSWEEFKTVKIGHLKLGSGRQKMVFKPNSKFEKGAILDLREIKLVPVKNNNH